MSQHAVREALSRMHMREVAIARPFADAMIADLTWAAHTTREIQDKAFLERRSEICQAYGFSAPDQNKPFAFANGIAIIPVTGTLINRFGSSYGSYVTGYNFIANQMRLAVADPDVTGIVLDINSYGGEAAGCFECSQLIYSMRGTKPIYAVVDSNAYSAGYAIASAADKIFGIPSSGEGSIGVVCMHVDMSGYLNDAGFKVTFIFAGDHKVDGNPYEPLPDDVKANLQAGVDKSRVKFATLVAQNRGLDYQVVFDTQAQCYRADDALALGLIDAIATPEEAMLAFLDDDSSESEADPDADDEPASDDSSATAHQQEQSTMMTDEEKLAHETALKEAANTARVAERARVKGITSHAEAASRPKLAAHLANNTSMTVEEAGEMLAVAAVETTAAAPAPAPAPAPAGSNGFTEAMNATGGAGVTGDAARGAQAGGAGPSTDDLVAQIVADQQAATGREPLKLVGKK